MKKLFKLSVIILLGVIFTSCSGAFIFLVDFFSTIILVGLGIIFLIVIISWIFDSVNR